MIAPWLGNALTIFGLKPFPGLDFTPFAFTISGLAVAWSLFRFRLFNIIPVAREAVIESMRDAVIVLDEQGRIVDLNPVAASAHQPLQAIIAHTHRRPARNLTGL